MAARAKNRKDEDAKEILFAWEGVSKSGREVSGEISGKSQAMVKAQLRQQGITPKSVKRRSRPKASKKKITPSDIAVFSRQLATMMSAGVPLVQGFEIIGRGHENPAMKKLLMSIASSISSGESLSKALGEHPKYFDPLFCNLVEAGEQGGILDTLLDKIATYKEKTEALKKKIKKALLYPAAVVTVAVIVTAVLLIFVVPTFQNLFNSFGAKLPAFTRMVISLSKWMQHYWWVVAFGAGLAGFAFTQARRRSEAFAYRVDEMMLKIPVIGRILEKAIIARFARTLATLFAAGVPLVEALESAAGASGNRVYERLILDMRMDVSSGQRLGLAMSYSKRFPNMVVQMTSIGEEAGALDAMLSKVADFFEQEVDAAVDGLSSLLEPMIMVILGVVVGGLVIAMYLPIFNLGKVV